MSESMSDLDGSALEAVPVFPLPHVVLFPHSRLPLHIFEPRYRKMLEDCLAHESKAIVIAQIDRRDGRIATIAGAGVIVEHEKLPDGRSNIVVAGRTRVRLDELALEDLPRYPYRRARATALASTETHVDDGERAALLATATMFTAEVKKHDPSFVLRLPEGMDAGAMADSCAFQLIVDAAARQASLEQLDPRARVRFVIDQLALQHGAMLGEPKGSVLN